MYDTRETFSVCFKTSDTSTSNVHNMWYYRINWCVDKNSLGHSIVEYSRGIAKIPDSLCVMNVNEKKIYKVLKKIVLKRKREKNVKTVICTYGGCWLTVSQCEQNCS